MEFGIEKCAMFIMKSRKRQMAEGLELPNQEKIRTLREKEKYNYLGILETDTIKHAEMKENFKKIIPQKMRKRLETKLHGRNLIKGIKTSAVLFVRY